MYWIIADPCTVLLYCTVANALLFFLLYHTVVYNSVAPYWPAVTPPPQKTCNRTTDSASHQPDADAGRNRQIRPTGGQNGNHSFPPRYSSCTVSPNNRSNSAFPTPHLLTALPLKEASAPPLSTLPSPPPAPAVLVGEIELCASLGVTVLPPPFFACLRSLAGSRHHHTTFGDESKGREGEVKGWWGGYDKNKTTSCIQLLQNKHKQT